MGLIIYLQSNEEKIENCQCDRCGNVHESNNFDYLDFRISHNLSRMAQEVSEDFYKTLWRPEELGFKKANELIPNLESGIKNLLSDSTKFKKLNPGPGLSTYNYLLDFSEKILVACKKFPDWDVTVSR